MEKLRNYVAWETFHLIRIVDIFECMDKCSHIMSVLRQSKIRSQTELIKRLENDGLHSSSDIFQR